MRTGVSYMGHHNPRHLATDLADMAALGCDDVLVAAQENDFVHMTGKIQFLPKIARDHGIRPIAIFWGALNLFGGGRSSQLLLDHPAAWQVNRFGQPRPHGCYNNPICVGRIQEMIDRIAEVGFQGYFVDEPTAMNCFCNSCRRLFGRWYHAELSEAEPARLAEFNSRCVVEYVRKIAEYCKRRHPQLETQCCVMPHDKTLWPAMAQIAELDNLGTDLYWVNNDRDVQEMKPIVSELAATCRSAGKKHHEWLQAWIVRKGREHRIIEQGDVLIGEQPDALYVWAYLSQIGTTESSQDPEAVWAAACELLRRAKASG